MVNEDDYQMQFAINIGNHGNVDMKVLNVAMKMGQSVPKWVKKPSFVL